MKWRDVKRICVKQILLKRSLSFKTTIKAEQQDRVSELVIRFSWFLNLLYRQDWDVCIYQRGDAYFFARFGCFFYFVFCSLCFFRSLHGANDCIIRQGLETENTMISENVAFMLPHYCGTSSPLLSFLTLFQEHEKKAIINNPLNAEALAKPMRVLRELWCCATLTLRAA